MRSLWGVQRCLPCGRCQGSVTMPKLTIDNREVQVPDGVTILDAAEKLGIEIPTMCFLKGYEPSTSCMVCVVEIEGKNGLVPACGTIVFEGMKVHTDTEQVLDARKTALELLLSDHLGDCLGPCQVTCPARMNIPLMIRQIASGQLRDAIETVKKDIPLPAVLGRICPAPCEKTCRRSAIDQAVSICLLKRYVADVDLQSDKPYKPKCKPASGKRVAIIGAGPAGLSAAYYLQQQGLACTIFDERENPGGMLRYGVSEKSLPRDVLEKEISQITAIGVQLKSNVKVGKSISMKDLYQDFDAIFVGCGKLETADAEALGLEIKAGGPVVDTQTYQTNMPGVFAGGGVIRNRKLAVRAVGDGKEAAVSILQYLAGEQVAGPAKVFNTRIGKIEDEEKEPFLASVSRSERVSPSSPDNGFTDQQAVNEARRCLHCDCRKPDKCKLRLYAGQYDAKATEFKSVRKSFVQYANHADIIYEPGKCIDCGLCIQIAAKAGEKLGFAFVGRGFNVKVAVPFGKSVEEGLKIAARDCAQACPTGALVLRTQ